MPASPLSEESTNFTRTARKNGKETQIYSLMLSSTVTPKPWHKYSRIKPIGIFSTYPQPITPKTLPIPSITALALILW